MKTKPTYNELEKELKLLKIQNQFLIQKNEEIKKYNSNSCSEKEDFVEKLQSERYLLDVLMETIPDRIYFKNTNSEFLKISSSLAKKHGIGKPENAIGKTDFDFFTNEHAQKAFDDEKKIIESGAALKNIEERETWNNGDVTWASTSKMPIIGENGKIIGTFGISRDITERKENQQALKKSELKLRELNATKDKFFSIIAHDLKSPFSGMLGIAELLIENLENQDSTNQKELLLFLQEGIQNAYKLLENLLLWSSSQRKSIDFKPKKENLFLLANETIKLLSQAAEKKSIKLINQIPQNRNAQVDKNMLLTILRNLINNAIKFTKKGGEINVFSQIKTPENNEKCIEVSVQDTGIGISPKILPKMFQITENISTEGTENEPGTGLGLILCKEFVEKHGGEIWVESEVGKGSQFIFTIPVKKHKTSKT